MKVLKKIAWLSLAALTILAVALFTACEEPKEETKKTATTYSLTVDNVTADMKGEAQLIELKYKLTSKPANAKKEGSFTITCDTCPTCDLIFENDKLKIPADFGPDTGNTKVYNLKLNFIPGGIGGIKASKAFTLTITKLPSVFDKVVVQNMDLYRKGATDAQRTIQFKVLDTNGVEMTAEEDRAKVALTVKDADGLTISTALVISEDASLTVDSTKSVKLGVKYDDVDQTDQTITITVKKLMLDVKFFRVVGTTAPAEIPAFQVSAEYGDTITEPANPDMEGFEYIGDGWYKAQTLAAGDKWDFTTDTVTAATSLYGSYKIVLTTFDIEFTVTLDGPGAVLEAGEIVVARVVQSSGWNHTNLTKQADDKWKGTASFLDKVPGSITYGILAVVEGASTETEVVFSERELTPFYYIKGTHGDVVQIDYTVTKWIRATPEEGELLENYSLKPSSGWSVPTSTWDFEGFTTSGMWLTADASQSPVKQGPGPRPPNVMYFRAWHRDSTSNWTTLGEPASITQKVDATVKELADGDDVTFYAWISNYDDSLDSANLIVGAQTYPIPVEKMPQGQASWVQVTFATQLTSADFEEGKLRVGVEFTGIEDTGDPEDPDYEPQYCKFSVDSFSLTKKTGTSGISKAFGITVEDISMGNGETKNIVSKIKVTDSSPTTGIDIEYFCTTCGATCELTIDKSTATHKVTTLSSAKAKEHIYSVTLKSDPLARGSFTITVGKTKYDLDVEITVDPAAKMYDGEVVYIIGSFYTDIGGNWGTSGGVKKLTKNGNVWSTTVTGINLTNTTIEYNINIGTDAAVGWTVGKYPQSASVETTRFTVTITDPNVNPKFTDTVTEWLGRPEVMDGQLIKNNAMNAVDNTGAEKWNWGDLKIWSFTNLAGGWLVGDGRTGTCFHDKPSNSEYISDLTKLIKITQKVAGGGDTIEDEPVAYTLAPDVKVKLSVWVMRINAQQDAFTLIVGGQEQIVTATNSTDWQLLEHTFTLAAEDFDTTEANTITGNGVIVGLGYKASAQTCSTKVDDFWLRIVP